MEGDADENAVKQVLDEYVRGTFEADRSALEKVFHADAVMNGFLNGELLMGSPDPFIANVTSNPSMKSQNAPYESEIASLEVTGSVASATLLERGFAGELSFRNYFHLIKENGNWSIVSKTFTTL